MLFISDLDLHPRSSLRLGDARAATVGDLRRPQDPQKPADVREELSGAVKVEAVPGRERSSGAPVTLLGGKCGIRSPLKRVSPWHSCRSHSELSVRDSEQSPGPGQRAGAPGSPPPPWGHSAAVPCPHRRWLRAVPTQGGWHFRGADFPSVPSFCSLELPAMVQLLLARSQSTAPTQTSLFYSCLLLFLSLGRGQSSS